MTGEPAGYTSPALGDVTEIVAIGFIVKGWLLTSDGTPSEASLTLILHWVEFMFGRFQEKDPDPCKLSAIVLHPIPLFDVNSILTEFIADPFQVIL